MSGQMNMNHTMTIQLTREAESALISTRMPLAHWILNNAIAHELPEVTQRCSVFDAGRCNSTSTPR